MSWSEFRRRIARAIYPEIEDRMAAVPAPGDPVRVLAREFARARGLRLSSVAIYVGREKKVAVAIGRLIEGGGFGLGEKDEADLIAWFWWNWPEGAAWPEGIARPEAAR